MAPPDGHEEVLASETDRHDFRPSRSSPTDGLVEWLTVHGERAGNVLVDSSSYLAFIAMVEVAIVMVVLSLPPSPAPIICALVTFAVYTSDHLVDDADESSRSAFANRYQDELSGLSALAYGLAITVAVLGGPVALLITLFPGVVWIVYASGRLPGLDVRVRRFKETLIVNSSLVALAWACTLTFLPLAFASRPITGVVAIVFVYFFFRSFVDTEIPNVRDEVADRLRGVSTLPVVFGLERTRQVLYGVDLLTAAIVGYATITGLVPAAIAMALLLGVAYSMGVVTLLGRVQDDQHLAIAAEFEYVVAGIALVPFVYGL